MPPKFVLGAKKPDGAIKKFGLGIPASNITPILSPSQVQVNLQDEVGNLQRVNHHEKNVGYNRIALSQSRYRRCNPPTRSTRRVIPRVTGCHQTCTLATLMEAASCRPYSGPLKRCTNSGVPIGIQNGPATPLHARGMSTKAMRCSRRCR